MTDSSAIIVVDTGSSCVKIGYAGEDLPRSVYPCVEGWTAHVHEGAAFPSRIRKPALPHFVDAGCPERERTYGKQPVERGVVTDFEALGLVWEFGLDLGLDSPPAGNGLCDGCPVMLTEAALADPASREEAAQFFFETAGAPAVAFGGSGPLALFASGRTRGLVLESGGGVTSAVPVFEGFGLKHATLKIDLGGQDVTQAMMASLKSAVSEGGGGGVSFQGVDTPVNPKTFTFAQTQLIKDRCATIWPTVQPPTDSDAKAGADQRGQVKLCEINSSYELPDGTFVVLDQSARATPADDLYFPAQGRKAYAQGVQKSSPESLPLAAAASEGLAALVHKAALMCDAELQQDLWGNVVCAGGGTLLPGFANRLDAELKALLGDLGAFPSTYAATSRSGAAPLVKVPVKVVPDPLAPERGFNSQRGSAAWVGASLFASLDTFGAVAATKVEWEEHGPVIVHKKGF